MAIKVTIRRPNGAIEETINKHYGNVMPGLLEAFQKANREAGRGEVLSIEYCDPRSEADKAYAAVFAARCEADDIEGRQMEIANGWERAAAAREKATRLMAEWRAKYPEAAAARDAKNAAEKARKATDLGQSFAARNID